MNHTSFSAEHRLIFMAEAPSGEKNNDKPDPKIDTKEAQPAASATPAESRGSKVDRIATFIANMFEKNSDLFSRVFSKMRGKTPSFKPGGTSAKLNIAGQNPQLVQAANQTIAASVSQLGNQVLNPAAIPALVMQINTALAQLGSFASTSLAAIVGHLNRYNPALQARAMGNQLVVQPMPQHLATGMQGGFGGFSVAGGHHGGMYPGGYPGGYGMYPGQPATQLGTPLVQPYNNPFHSGYNPHMPYYNVNQPFQNAMSQLNPYKNPLATLGNNRPTMMPQYPQYGTNPAAQGYAHAAPQMANGYGYPQQTPAYGARGGFNVAGAGPRGGFQVGGQFGGRRLG